MGESAFLLLMQLLLAALVTKTGGATLRLELTGPSKAYLKSTVMFQCKLSELIFPRSCDLIKDSGDVLDTKLCESQPVTFYLKVDDRSEGEYFCRVRTKEQTETSNAVKLQVVIPVQGTHLASEPSPPIIYEGAGFTLRCHVRRGTLPTYVWYHNKQLVATSTPLHRLSGSTLTVEQASERHAGTYSCEAQNYIKDHTRHSSSRDITIVVKKYLSAPRLSFRLYHDDSGYRANISCRSERGTPPVTFQLLLDGKHMEAKQVYLLEAFFTLPVTVGLDMGVLRCSAQTDMHHLLSDPVDLEVAPVGGTAYIHMQYLWRTESVLPAALLQCNVTRGTFPIFSWSFNHSPVPPEGESHAIISHGSKLILIDINTGNSGYYSCRARDSFNSSSSWLESKEVMVNETGIGATYVEVIAVAFYCFLLVIIVGGACCLLSTIKCRRDHDTSPNDQHMDICEQTNRETETMSEAQVEEMETVIMEKEV
ncbi:Fc receptor-like protein 5 isoform X1 [Electrophorus electricus]|uniref:Fc receptor-like protein 5 isoform X1 n=2 Tax=Electrophorus electricus TaxID=8005 RepID=UPI000F0A455C|nr:Fc receptor-like protein 5 isoform X1 [Electrophorus electricus]XP_026885280.1 Fc receptor-like protein 5 isoform X1 [Electrophorus electricus]